MRTLLLSDVHSNLVALEAVLAAAGEFDRLWCLGDLVGYGPAPNECIARLRQLPLLSLAGNHDWGALGKLDVDDFNPDARRALLWTRKALTEENRAWLDQLPDHLTLPEEDLTLVHGSPRYPIWEYVGTAWLAAENMPYFDTAACLCGHTHIPALYVQEPERVVRAVEFRPDATLTLRHKSIFNPGSVGQPRDGDSRASFAIYDSDARTMTHCRVEYDIARTQAAMAQAQLPPRLIARLERGM